MSPEKAKKPNDFYRKVDGETKEDPTKRKVNIVTKNQNPPAGPVKPESPAQPIPKPFDPQEYKKETNKKLESMGSPVKVYDKSSYNLLIAILIGVTIVFGLFFVWSVSADKFKGDMNCPSCVCEAPVVSCPATICPDCVCNEVFTCEKINESKIVDAINNISWYNLSSS